MAYCAYVRKSRIDAEAERVSHEDTLARQRAIIMDLARSNRHHLDEVYEEVVSGDSISDRPQMQRLIADMLAGKWQGVYVTAIDRLARGDTADQGYLMRVLNVSGVKVITPTRVLDTRNPDDELNVEFSMFIARQEYKASTRRQQAGRERSLKEGKWPASSAAYGYRRHKYTNQRGWTLTIEPQEADVVRQVYQWYLHGADGQPMGLTVIASRLTDMAVPVGEHGKAWTASRIYRMLTNPIYTGCVRWGYDKVQRIVAPDGVTKKRTINTDARIGDGLHDAIISQDDYEAIQAKLHGYNKHLPVRKGAALANPLAGLVFCAECGHVMSHLPASGRQPAILKCRTRGCPTVQNYRAPIEEAVLSALRSWLDDAGRISSPETETPRAPIVSALDSMRAEQEKLLKQVDRLQDLLEQEVYTVEQYTQRFAKLQIRLARLADEIAAEQQRIDSQPVYATPAELAPAIVRLLDAYPTATAQQKNDMLKQCISSVMYRKEKQGNVIRGHVYADPNGFQLDIFPLIKR